MNKSYRERSKNFTILTATIDWNEAEKFISEERENFKFYLHFAYFGTVLKNHKAIPDIGFVELNLLEFQWTVVLNERNLKFFQEILSKRAFTGGMLLQ